MSSKTWKRRPAPFSVGPYFLLVYVSGIFWGVTGAAVTLIVLMLLTWALVKGGKK